MISLIYTSHYKEELTPAIVATIQSSNIFVDENANDYVKCIGIEKKYNMIAKGLMSPEAEDLEL